MAMRKSEDSPRLPRFKSRREEAEFWETHSPMDYPEFQEVHDLTFSKALNHILPIRLDSTSSEKLAHLARKRGMGSSTLARMWLLERLESEAEPSGESA